MSYFHQFLYHKNIDLPFRKAVCVGRNYVLHAKELNNPIPSEPILFIKPASCAVSFEPGFTIPTDQGNVHFEAEIAILIDKNLNGLISNYQAQSAITAIGCALDLTLRNKQTYLKQQGLPWELAKSFDGALVLTPFVEAKNLDLTNLDIKLTINNELKQHGNSNQMIWSILDLIKHIALHFRLEPGDIILTGTPAGVGVLNIGDNLQLELNNSFLFKSVVN